MRPNFDLKINGWERLEKSLPFFFFLVSTLFIIPFSLASPFGYDITDVGGPGNLFGYGTENAESGATFTFINSSSIWNLSTTNIFPRSLSYPVGIGTKTPIGLFEVKDSATTLVVISSGVGNENATLDFREADVLRAAIEYSGFNSILRIRSKYAGSEDDLMSFNVVSHEIIMGSGNVKVTNGNLTISNGNLTANNICYSNGTNCNLTGATFNATYNGIFNNESYLTTYNESYDTHINNWTMHNDTFWYNQTTPAITDINSRFWNKTQTYNITEADDRYCYANGTNITGTSCMVAGTFSTYNATYDALNTTYGKYWYNMSDGSYNITYDSLNSTYGKYWYNMSDGSYNITYDSLNSTYGKYWYNMTVAGSGGTFNATYDALNSTYGKYWYNMSDGSYNVSYDAGLKWFYNMSTHSYNLNASYNRWWYNMSDGSYNVSYLTSAGFNAGNITTGNIATTRITNVTCAGSTVMQNYTTSGAQCITPTAAAVESDPYWSANLTGGINGDVVPYINIIQSLGTYAKRWLNVFSHNLYVYNNATIVNLTINQTAGGVNTTIKIPGGSGALIFTDDSDPIMWLDQSDTVTIKNLRVTGSINSPTFQELNRDKKTNNYTSWGNATTSTNQTLFSFDTVAYNNYTMRCDLWVGSAAITTGVQMNVTHSTAPTYMNVRFMTNRSISPKGGEACAGAISGCQDLAISGIVYASPSGVVMESIYVRIKVNTAGKLNVTMKSEIANSLVSVAKGSYCRLLNENSIQSVPV